MAHARSREEWGRMSALMALVANVNRDPKRTRAFRPADFDPYAAAETRLDSPDLEDRLREAIAGALSGNSPESPALPPAP